MSKDASPGLIALLNTSRTFQMADLFTFTLVGDTVLRYTSKDQDIPFDGHTFAKLRMTRGKIKWTVGLEVDELSITINPRVDEWMGTVDLWLPGVRKGVLDSAQVTLQRVFMPTFGDTSLGAITMFSGRVSDANASRSEVQLTVKSELELFNTKFPRNLYQSGCLNNLFDNACGKNKGAYAVNGVVTSATSNVIHSGLAQPDGYFSVGSIRFTSGDNEGLSCAVREYAAGTFTTFLPLSNPPAPGDTFIAWPGCDKTMATCTARFGNLPNFRGFPFVPDPEAAV